MKIRCFDSSGWSFAIRRWHVLCATAVSLNAILILSSASGDAVLAKNTGDTFKKNLGTDPISVKVHRLIDRNQLEEALSLLNQALEKEPDAVKFLLLRSEVKFRMNKNHGALRDAQEALSRDPKNITAMQLIGRVYRAAGDKPRALAAYLRALKIDPKNSYTHFIIANLYFVQQKYSEAEKYYKPARDLDPDNVHYRLNRAENLSHLQRFDEAFQDCDHAIKLRPDLFQSYNIKAIVYYKKGDRKNAIKQLEKALSVNPHSSLLLCNLAAMKDENGDRQGAINTYTEAIKVHPKNGSALSARGNLYLLMGDYTRARQDLDLAIQLQPKNLTAYLNRAKVFAQTGQLEESVADFEQAQKLLYATLAKSGNTVRSPSAKDLNNMIDGYTRLLKINPKDNASLYNRGCAYFCLSKFKEARNDFEKFFDSNKEKKRSSIYAAVFHHLACVLDGDRKNADKLLSRCNVERGSWPQPLVLFLRGKMTDAKLLSLANGSNQLTTSRFVIGMKQIAGGEKDAGVSSLKWVTAHGESNMDEFMMTVCQLERPAETQSALEKLSPVR